MTLKKLVTWLNLTNTWLMYFIIMALRLISMLNKASIIKVKKNPYHLTQSLARYSLFPKPFDFVKTSIEINELKFIYFYLTNIYKQIGLKGWRPEKFNSFNNSSSPGYKLNRYFIDNECASSFLDYLCDVFIKICDKNMIPTQIFGSFEKIGIFKKHKIPELRTIAQGRLEHSVVGKRFSHIAEHKYIHSTGATWMRMGFSITGDGLGKLCRSTEYNRFIHRSEDLSKQDTAEHGALMSVITQARSDISDMTISEKKVFAAISEQNVNAIRVTPFGEIIHFNGSKVSGGSHTTLNNCDKHMVLIALETAKIISNEEKIEFIPENFVTIVNLFDQYVRNDIYSDDAIRHIVKNISKYFIDPKNPNIKTLQSDLLERLCFLIKPNNVSPWCETMFHNHGSEIEWLGNYIDKIDGKYFPNKNRDRMLFTLIAINPEAKAKKFLLKNDNSLMGLAYRLIKVMSMMVYSVSDEEFFSVLCKVRDHIVKEINIKHGFEKIDFQQLIDAETGENPFLSMFVLIDQIGTGSFSKFWTMADFREFICFRKKFFMSPSHFQALITEGCTSGYNFENGSNNLVEFLIDCDVPIKNNKDSTVYAVSEMEKYPPNDQFYPFFHVDRYNCSSYLRILLQSRRSMYLNDFQIEQTIKRMLFSKNISVYNFEHRDEVNTHVIRYHKLSQFHLDNHNRNYKMFVIIPTNKRLYYSRNLSMYFNDNVVSIYNGDYEKIELPLLPPESYGSVEHIDTECKLVEINFKAFNTKVFDRSGILSGKFDSNEIRDNKEEFFGYRHPGDGNMLERIYSTLDNILISVDDRLVEFLLGTNPPSKLKLSNKDTGKFIFFVSGGAGCGKTHQLVRVSNNAQKKNHVVGIVSTVNEHVCRIAEVLHRQNIKFQYNFSSKAVSEGKIPPELREHKEKENIILCTTSIAFKSKCLRRCDVLVVDESSKISVADLCLLTSGPYYRKFKKILLFGDKYQSIVYNPKNLETHYMHPITNFVPASDTIFLNCSRRLGPQTLKMLNHIAYKEEPLVSGKSTDEILEERIIVKIICSNPLDMFETKAITDDQLLSWCNTINIGITVSIIQQNPEKQFQVITPYLGQVAKYMEAGINAITVDSSQSREFDHVILDTVRCNRNGSAGFILDPSRLVVALSRHKKTLTILCCKNVFKKLPISVANYSYLL
uniref:RNA-dependent RNA polymerase n=1 Tax=Bemisia tabaci nido-like virus 1 TaxID=2840075 RepID=A0A8E8FU59_9NIDO|nr:RNA-dependent RNA polymerase [Bemisia tabaci nido-like virus 1]